MIKKAYEITDAKIQFVSLVDKAANKKPFLLKKEDKGKAAFTTYGKIIKADTDNHYVTGIVYEPMTEDCHGNYMTAEEITKAAYWFAKNGDKVDLQHSFGPLEDAAVVESWIAKDDSAAFRHLMVEALKYPDLKNEELMKFYNCFDVTKMPELVFQSFEEFDYVSKIIMAALGLGEYPETEEGTKEETEEEKLLDEAKN